MSGRWISVMLLGGMMVIGCEKSETAPTTAPSASSAADSAKDTAKDAGAAMKDTAKDAGAAMKDGAKDAGAAVKDTAAAAKDAVTPATAPAVPAPADVSATAADKSAEAQKLLDQALGYIKENKLDLADKTITQLEGMKTNLSPALQTAVDNARKSLTAAKAGGLLGK